MKETEMSSAETEPEFPNAIAMKYDKTDKTSSTNWELSGKFGKNWKRKNEEINVVRLYKNSSEFNKLDYRLRNSFQYSIWLNVKLRSNL
jgi:hypothetical protein